MPFNGLGTVSRVYSWVTDASNNLNVDATRMDTDTNDIAAALSLCITKDGQQAVTANIPMNSHKFTGLSAGSTNGDSVRWEQISAIATWAAAPSSANLLAVLTDKTGTGLNVFSASPVLSGTPAISGGVLQIYNGTQTRFGGLAAEASSAIVDFGINDDTNNRFGGAYTQADQGGFARFDTRAGQPLFQIYARSATGTTASGLLGFTSDGRLYGAALHNNAGAVTGTTNQYIASGTYTPTTSGGVNLDASSINQCRWIRVGNVVTVTGSGTLDPTTANSNTVLLLTLPIASTLTAASHKDLSGTGTFDPLNTTLRPVSFLADAGGTKAELLFTPAGSANAPLDFMFAYEVL